MFSSERVTFRGGVLRGPAAPPAPARHAPEPEAPTAAWLPEDLVVETDFGALPEFDAPEAEPALSPEELAALHAEEEAERRAAEERRLAELAEQEALQREQEINAAYAAGLEVGRAEGEAAVRAELDAVTAALMQALADVRGGEQRWLGALEENVAALATAVARHVIGREVAADPSSVIELARQAIAEFPVDEPITLRVAPEDHAAVKAALAAAHAAAPAAPGARETRCVADPHVARGGALVEGRERIVDGRVDSALERVYRRLSHHHA